MIYKDREKDILVFQSPTQEKLWKNIGMIYLSMELFSLLQKRWVSNFSDLCISFMISWSLLPGKSSDDYYTALNEINKNILSLFNEENVPYYPIYCHCD